MGGSNSKSSIMLLDAVRSIGSVENVDKRIHAILDEGLANINDRDNNGNSVLQIAVSHGQVAIVRLLLEHDKYASKLKIDLPNKHGWTPLHRAAHNGFTNICRLLIEKGSKSANLMDGTGWTPWHLASHNDHEDSAKLLEANGADTTLEMPCGGI